MKKQEWQQIRWSDEYWKFTVAANIKEYHIISKLTYGRSGNECRVASLFTRYLTAIGIIPESLKSISQF